MNPGTGPVALLALLATACATAREGAVAEPEPDAQAGEPDSDASEPASPDADAPGDVPGAEGDLDRSASPFDPVGSYVLDASGTTASIALPIPPGAGTTFLRVVPDGTAEGACWAVSEDAAVLEPWDPWSAARGYAIAALDSAAGDPGTGERSIRVVAVECLTGLSPDAVSGTELAVTLPAKVRLERKDLPAPSDGATALLEVRLHVAEDAFPGDDAAEDPALDQALPLVRSVLLEEAGVELVSSVHPLPAAAGEVVYDRRDPAALDLLAVLAGEGTGPERTGLPAVLVPCLREENPALGTSDAQAGVVTRRPGGFPEPGVADLVLVATGHCDGAVPASAEDLAGRLAHEIGHWLGLRHAPAPGLMAPEPGGPATWTLTAEERSLLRRHPALVWDASR